MAKPKFTILHSNAARSCVFEHFVDIKRWRVNKTPKFKWLSQKTIRADFEINRNFLTPPLLKKNKQKQKQTNKQAKKNKSRLTKNRKTHRRNEMERKTK